jgi:1-acyl-sn-glycerol-3-phosphate acyltransferase
MTIQNPRPPEVPLPIAWLARALLSLAGWKIEGAVPNLPKFVIIGAHHTSNWDGLLMMFAAQAVRVRLHWMGKDALFRYPLGILMRALGGIPINRRTKHGVVEQMVDEFNRRERLVLVIAPEGTRQKVERWKTGFYFIAQGANVPVVLAYPDYRRKVVGIGPVVYPTGDTDKDIAAMRAFYNDKIGRHPERMSVTIDTKV